MSKFYFFHELDKVENILFNCDEYIIKDYKQY
jgi:hypothetical protein